jgi:hypothetical protein
MTVSHWEGDGVRYKKSRGVKKAITRNWKINIFSEKKNLGLEVRTKVKKNNL